MIAVAVGLEVIDRVLLANDVVELTDAVIQGNDARAEEKAIEVATSLGIEVTVGIFVPGSMVATKVVMALPKKGRDDLADQYQRAADVARVTPTSTVGADWIDDVARNATRNADSDKLVLGHFSDEGTSYQKVAAHYNATYFKVDYNEVRPHSSLGYLTPRQFINQSTEESDRAVLQ